MRAGSRGWWTGLLSPANVPSMSGPLRMESLADGSQYLSSREVCGGGLRWSITCYIFSHHLKWSALSVGTYSLWTFFFPTMWTWVNFSETFSELYVTRVVWGVGMGMGKPQLLLVPRACPLPNFPGPQPPSLSPHLHAHTSLYPSCQWLKMSLGLEPTSDIFIHWLSV